MTADSDEDSDAFQESFQELPTFPKVGGSMSSSDHTPRPLQTPQVGFTLPPAERRADSDSADLAGNRESEVSNGGKKNCL